MATPLPLWVSSTPDITRQTMTNCTVPMYKPTHLTLYLSLCIAGTIVLGLFLVIICCIYIKLAARSRKRVKKCSNQTAGLSVITEEQTSKEYPWKNDNNELDLADDDYYTYAETQQKMTTLDYRNAGVTQYINVK